MIAVTGATGHLGRLVIDALLKRRPATEIVAVARDPAKATDLATQGVEVREGDYDRPQTLAGAFAGVDKLLLISSNTVGQRFGQHLAAIQAAKQAGVKQIVYTSVLHADRSPLGLAEDHRQTEAALKASGVPHVVLRNGWYTENHLAGLAPALEHGVLLGAAQDGLISSASRADYAEAAAVVLTRDGESGRIYELAGDDSWTLADFAAEASKQSGKTVAYRDLSQADYEVALLGAGLPAPIAQLLADCDAATAKGALHDTSGTLGLLIGRPTTPMRDSLSAALGS